jgi:hypothetical protein
MKTTNNVKKIAGLILILTFFLPLSRCEMKKIEVQQAPAVAVGEDRKVIDSPKIMRSGANEEMDTSSNKESNKGYNIPFRMFSSSELLSWLMLLSFFWPVPVLTLFHFEKRKIILLGLTVTDPLVCIGSGYLIWAISTLGDILFGGCLALGAILSYFFASCYDNYFLIKQLIKNKKGEQDSSLGLGPQYGPRP